VCTAEHQNAAGEQYTDPDDDESEHDEEHFQQNGKHAHDLRPGGARERRRDRTDLRSKPAHRALPDPAHRDKRDLILAARTKSYRLIHSGVMDRLTVAHSPALVTTFTRRALLRQILITRPERGTSRPSGDIAMRPLTESAPLQTRPVFIIYFPCQTQHFDPEFSRRRGLC
jgi:hypothetical protein